MLEIKMNERPRSIGLFALFLGLAVSGWFFPAASRADDFGRIYYDKKTGQLVVTMIYRGTNPNHQFSLKWGECQAGDPPSVTAEVLDDQFNDLATTNFKKTTRFDLSDMPCARPASITLRSAPRFFFTLTIPG
jgi:hypothetical protein